MTTDNTLNLLPLFHHHDIQTWLKQALSSVQTLKGVRRVVVSVAGHLGSVHDESVQLLDESVSLTL